MSVSDILTHPMMATRRPPTSDGLPPVRSPQPVDTAYLKGFDVSQEMTRLTAAGRTSERIEKERDWWINWNAYKGQPFFRKNFSTGKIDFVPLEERQHFKVYNLIKPRIRTLVGNETYVPRFRARNTAAMGTDEEMRRRGVEDVCNHACRAAKLSRAKRKADLWKHVFSHIWFHGYWDPTKGPRGPVYGEVDCPLCGGQGTMSGIDGGQSPCPQCSVKTAQTEHMGPGKTYGTQGNGPQGEVAVDVCAPWEILCDTSARDMFDIRWLIRERILDRELAWQTFAKDSGIPLDRIPRQDQSQSLGMSNFMSGVDGRRIGSAQDVTTVRELWMRPTEKHPLGIYGCMVGGVVVKGGQNPWEGALIPYIPYRCREDPGYFYPTSTADDLVPVNNLFIDRMQKFDEHTDMGLVMRLLVPEGVAVTFDDVPGIAHFNHKPNLPKPEFLNHPGTNNDVTSSVQMMEKYADEQSSVSDAMRGQLSQDDPNASFAAFQEQRAVTPIKDMIEDNNDSLTLVGQLLTAIAKLMYLPGRLLKSVWGTGGKVILQSFDGSRVGDFSDIELIPERDIGRTLATRRKEVMEASKAGVFADPRLMKLMEYAEDDDIYQDMVLDEEVAAQDVKMIEGIDPRTLPPAEMIMMIPVGPPLIEAKMWEDHEIHTRVKKRELNRMRITYGNKADPRCAILERNILDHTAMLQIEMQLSQQRMMAMASQYGLANAAGGAGGAPAAGAPTGDPLAQGQPGPVGTQPALAQANQAVDEAVKQGGAG